MTHNNDHRTSLARPGRLRLAACGALLAIASIAAAQQPAGPRITPNFKDADITQIIEAVSAATGKNFIVDPRVGRQQVTMLSTTPMTPDAFYQAFLSILQVYGFVAVQTGDIIKIIPDANARQFPSVDLPDRVSSTSDEIVTQVIAVKNVNAAQLVPILRPLIPQYGHLAAYPASNMLIISDRANNVNRIVRIIRRIDQGGDAEIEVIPMQNASATEIVRVVAQLVQGAAAAEGGGANLKLVADDRTNSVLLSGEQSARLRVKALIAHLDTPLESGGDTQVRYLRYSDAEKIAAKLKEQLTGVGAAAPGAAGAAAAGPSAQAERGTTIWADPDNNALVVTAPPKTMRNLMAIVDKLDIRRAQVLVQAVIVEVRADKTAELGINWAVDGSKDNFLVGSFVQPIAGGSIVDIIRGIDNPTSIDPKAILGTTIGGGRVQDTGTNWAAVLRAIRNDADTNIVATPSIVTLDNQEAQIKVAQEVPFITGQYTNTGSGGNNGSVNPFQTIQREEVGTILKITPQINEGDSVILKIEQEASSLSTSTASAVDLITNKRVINTSLLVEDGGTIVLGGLIQEEDRRGEQRVPLLGRIPLIGEFFKVRQASKVKTNLMVFIQPKILRDGVQSSFETNSKYNFIREEQRKLGPRFEVLPLLPGQKNAVLPPLPQPAPPPAQQPGVEQPDTAKPDAAQPAEPPATTPPPESR
ncbi:MAG: type II secretion system secretin GspD [Steroidobacteraceae bacterium]